MPDLPAIPIQQLLAHREWVRRLALRLVRDESRADDIEQQTWLAALDRPPTGSTPKAWLGQVVRNLAGRARRSEVRVDRRERAAARLEALPGTGDVVAQAELHARLVQAVLDLDPPYRRSLLLRYFESLPPREIAVRMGVSVETARSRVRRGLQQLRARLDAEHDGSRRAWCLALLRFTVPHGSLRATAAASTALAGTGVLIMSAKSKIVAMVAAAFLLAGGAWWFFSQAENTPVNDVTVDSKDRGPQVQPGLDSNTKRPEQTAAPRAEASAHLAAPPPFEPGTSWVRIARGAKGDAVGVAGAYARLVLPQGNVFDTECDEWGRAELPQEHVGASAALFALDLKTRTFVRRRVTVPEGELLVLLPPRREVEVVLKDEFDRPISARDAKQRYQRAGLRPLVRLVSHDALTSADRSRSLENMLGLSDGLSQRSMLRFETDRVLLDIVPTDGAWQILMERPGAAPDLTSVIQLGGEKAKAVEMRLPLEPEVIRIRVLGAEDGAVLRGAVVQPYFEIGDDAAFVPGVTRRTDENGEVSIPKFDAGNRRGQRAPSWWITTVDRAVLVPSSLLRDSGSGGTLEVRAPRTGSVRGRAFLRGGTPAVGKTIITGRKGRRVRTRVGPDGGYRLDGVAASEGSRVQLFLVEDLASAAIQIGRVALEPGGVATCDFGRVSSPSEVATVEGRVTAGGVPLSNLLLVVRPPGKKEGMVTARSGADGRFRLEGIEPGAREFLLILGDYRVSDDFSVESDPHLTLEAGDLKTLTFDLPAGVVDVVLLDAESGEPISGGGAMVRPTDREQGRRRFEGFQTSLGWGAYAGKDGVARLRGLPLRVPLTVRCGALGYKGSTRADVEAGSDEEPRRVEVRLTKKN